MAMPEAGQPLFVHVGNTHTVLALAGTTGTFRKCVLPTPRSPADVEALQREPACRELLDAAGACYLGGVVPEAMQLLAQRLPLQPLSRRRAASLLDMDYNPPDSLGFDRLCKLLAAAAMHPGETTIVVDMGTATTIDLLLEARRFAGGLVMPGEQACLDALHAATAQLPQLEAGGGEAYQSAGVGTKTSECMHLGVDAMIVGGLRQALDGLLSAHSGAGLLITGGGAERFLPVLQGLYPLRYEADLVLRGMQVLAGLEIAALGRGVP